VVCVAYSPTNDGPEWLFSAHLANHYSDAGSLYSAQVVPALQFAARGFNLVGDPLESLVGWRRCQQIVLSLIVLLHAFGFAYLVGQVAPDRRAARFLGFPLALSWPVYMGFFAFTIASGMGLFVVGFAMARRPATWKRSAAVALLLLLVAVCHVFAAVLAGIVIAVVWLCRAPSGDRLKQCLRLACVGAPAAGVLIGAFATGRRSTEQLFGRVAFLHLDAAILDMPQILVPGPRARALLILVALAGCVFVVAYRLVVGRLEADDRALSIVGITFLAMGLFGPFNIPGWQCFSPRFLPLGVLALLASVPFESLVGRARARAFDLAVYAACVVWLASSYPFHRRLEASCADALAALGSPLSRNGGLELPIDLDPRAGLVGADEHSEVPYLAPVIHFGALFAIEHQASTPYFFGGGPATINFVPRKPPVLQYRIPDREHYWPLLDSTAFSTNLAVRRRVIDELVAYAAGYTRVTLTGARPADIAQWKERGFVGDVEHGTAFVGHLVPCGVLIDVPEGAALPFVDLGLGGVPAMVNARPREVPATRAGARTLVLDGRAPCGEVWLRVHWEGPAGAANVRHATCAAADGEDALNVTLEREPSRIDCTALRETIVPMASAPHADSTPQ
jgi:hypothetical protein